jgi:hypothetical protein
MRDDFDPTEWRDCQRRRLEELWTAGKVDLKTYREARDHLDRLYREIMGFPPISEPHRTGDS